MSNTLYECPAGERVYASKADRIVTGHRALPGGGTVIEYELICPVHGELLYDGSTLAYIDGEVLSSEELEKAEELWTIDSVLDLSSVT